MTLLASYLCYVGHLPVSFCYVLGVRIQNGVLNERQITPRKSRTSFVKILLFTLNISRNPFVLGKISNAICKSELPLGIEVRVWVFFRFYLSDNLTMGKFRR